MTLARNIFLARRSINYVNIKVGIISPNKFNPVTRGNVHNRIQFDNELAYIRRVVYSKLYLTLSDSLNRTGCLANNKQFFNYFSKITSAYATERKVGNCGELSCIALAHLKLLGAKPLDFFAIDMNNQRQEKHAFIVIGRTTGNPIQPATWNREAVICDPWCHKAYSVQNYSANVPFQGDLLLEYRYE
ncbi:hypothetical protein [Xenorhabdus lircayensis]|uniref:Transglutaminase-like domain-containing protein n=1 Tax=Xenorhabdus lircayensis TaxID=2763499 RepID=A0ABS0U7X0_9GAMM|nr:hypothetical protein [Xenorhabdus lircayensis]MBI6549609.1 hypothetical protein [Xenorhabdus lircayensis]